MLDADSTCRHCKWRSVSLSLGFQASGRPTASLVQTPARLAVSDVRSALQMDLRPYVEEQIRAFHRRDKWTFQECKKLLTRKQASYISAIVSPRTADGI